MRDTARAPQPPTKWAGKAWPKMNKNAIFGPNLDFFGQKILIFTKEIKSFVTHIRKTHLGTLFTFVFGQTMDNMWQKMAIFWPKMTTNADFGPNLAIFRPKILIFMGVSKSFGTNITENHSGNLSALFFWSGIRSNGPKKADIWPKMPVLGQIWPFLGPKSNFLGAGSKTFGTLILGFQWDTFLCWKHWSLRLQLAARGENVPFWPKNLDIWG